MPDEWDQEQAQIWAANTAQGVYKHLRALESNRSRVLRRWVWELLQNARDVANGHGSLVASFEVNDDELTFRHNGRGFERNEITHLIHYGTTKLERDKELGQFGSGFLTTHLLSPTIDVSSHLSDGRPFAFKLDRNGSDVADLQRHMATSWEAFKHSVSSRGQPAEKRSSTAFRYPIDERAFEAVNQGIDALARSGPYVAAFNPEFRSIQILSAIGARVIELTKRDTLDEYIDRVHVSVSEPDDAYPTSYSYLIAEVDSVAVAVPIVHDDPDPALGFVTDAPKLLLGFPLIGTEDFSFPATIHSQRFSPTEERDGVFLGRSDDDANLQNQAVLQQACRLVLSLIQFAARSAWRNAHVLAHVPPIRAHSWLDPEWLRKCLKAHLIDPMRATPAVVNESGSALPPNAATLPTANKPEAVDQLWRLASCMSTLSDTLPRRSEAQGWYNAVRQWADIYDCPVDSLDETINGRDLALRAESARTLEQLQSLLLEGSSASDWLSGLHQFLAGNGFAELLRTLQIIPDQTGRLRQLSQLHRDQGIPDELKAIAELADWDLRAELRDTRCTVLPDEPGAGDLDSEGVVLRLIRLLRERMDSGVSSESQAASVGLFAWIADHERWYHLRGFPAVSDQGESSQLIVLDRHEEQDVERPLAPVSIWPEELRAYAELFPRSYILAADYATQLPNPRAWATLEQHTYVRTSVLFSQKTELNQFLPDEPSSEDDEGPVDHRAVDEVEVTEVAFLIKRDVGVLNKVRQSRPQARLFWGFLTQWLVQQDVHALEPKPSMCICGDVHRYFPAAWLVPVVRNQWVPPLQGRRTDRATAHSLANLIRDSDWPTRLLGGSPQVTELLSALGISVPDLIMALVTRDEQERSALNQTLSDLLSSVRHDWSLLNDLAEDLQDDARLFEHLAERRELRRTVRENQRSGALVETLVKNGIEDEGFTVRRTGIGSDYAIELTHVERTWLVEIKSTRDTSVTMTSTQAKTAVARGPEFLLCVVPLSRELDDPDIDDVRALIRFVAGIGAALAPICEDMDNLEDLRATVTSGDDTDLRLEVESGSPRIRVASPVWIAGFGLSELFARLSAELVVDHNTIRD